MPEWPRQRLGDLVDLLIGPPFKSSVFRGATHGTRLLRGMNLGPGATRWDETFLWPDEELKPFARYALAEGDLCIAMDATFNGSGSIRAAVIGRDDLPCLLVQRVARLRLADPVLRAFLWLHLTSSTFSSHLSGRQTGAFAPHISGKDIASFEVPLPPREEQRRIVDLIGALDAHIASLDKERTACMMLASVLPVPVESVKTRPLGASVRARGGKRMPKGEPFADAVTAHPYLRVVDMHDGTFLANDLVHVPDHVWPQIRRYTVEPDDLVISIVGTIGRVAFVPTWAAGANLTENAAVIHIQDDSIDKAWLCAWLTSEQGQREIDRVTVGTSQWKLALVRIPLIEVPDISRAEQERLGRASSDARTLARILRAESEKLRVIRGQLLGGLLNAEVPIPDSYDALLTGAA